MSSKNSKNSFLAATACALSACSRKEPDPTPTILSLGIYIFFAFVGIIALSHLLPYIQRLPITQRIKAAIKIPTIVGGVCLQILGLSLIWVFWPEKEQTTFLFVFVGVALIVCGYYLIRWARRTTQGSSIEIKIVGICVTAIITFLWLIFRAADTVKL